MNDSNHVISFQLTMENQTNQWYIEPPYGGVVFELQPAHDADPHIEYTPHFVGVHDNRVKVWGQWAGGGSEIKYVDVHGEAV